MFLKRLSLVSRMRLVRRFSSKDIYKEINYVCPFNESQNELVAEKINLCKSPEELQAIGVSKKWSVLIFNHMQNHGGFSQVEQILDVESMKVSSLETMVKGIIKKSDGGSGERRKKSSNDAITKAVIKNVYPSLNPSVWTNSKNFCSLKFNLESLSWCRLDKSGEVTTIDDWNFVKTLKHHEGGSKKNFHPHTVLCKSKELAKVIPEADFYVIEECPLPLAKDPYMLPKIHLLEFQASLLAFLNFRSSIHDQDVSRIFFLKSSVLDKMFDLKVGNTRVAMQKDLWKILQKRELLKSPQMMQNSHGLVVSDQQKEEFNKMKEKKVKEQMSLSLIGAMAMHLIASHKIATMEIGKEDQSPSLEGDQSPSSSYC